MTKMIGSAIATFVAAGAIGLTSVASAAPKPAPKVTSVKCPSVCPDVVWPVTCLLSDGSVRTFTNRCFAGVFACQHRLRIISCRPAGD
jgi:hypothetical protein